MPNLRHCATATVSKVTYYFLIDKLIHLFLIPVLLDLFVRTDTLHHPIMKTPPVVSASLLSPAPFILMASLSRLSLMVRIAFVSVFHPLGLPLAPTSSINSSRLKAMFYILGLPPECLSHISKPGMNISAWRLPW